MNAYDFGGRTIVITGGAGRIGVECTKLLVAGASFVNSRIIQNQRRRSA